MTQVISLVATATATAPKPMTPATPSPMDLDEQHQQRHQQRYQQQQQHDHHYRPKGFRASATTPDSSPSPRSSAGLARKRAASINTAEANYARLEQLRLNTPSSMNESPKDLICLCTPAPKIPRPRNAFILYRQHHQARVVQENPNLSNPEISKIIGEKWKEESEAVKNDWKGLADEEKQRHQQQYPDYRYQPRRGARAQASRSGTSPADSEGRCPKCHGRSIATPRTPSTPFSTPTAAKPSMSPFPPNDLREGSKLSSFLTSNVPVRNTPLRQYARPSEITPAPPPYREIDYDPESPEMKRRRFNSAVSYHYVSSPGTQHEVYLSRQQAHPVRTQSIGAAPPGMRAFSPALPEPGSLPRSKSGPMPPPPRPASSGTWAEQQPRPGRHASFDESLRLPPLQTSVPMSPSVAAEVDVRQITTPVNSLGITTARDPQARSVEAMVMSIPFTRKLNVLSTISHPLAPPRPGSPVPENRGAIIAIEGPKLRMLQQVGQVIEKTLAASSEIALKTWHNHEAEDRRGSDASQSDGDETPLEMGSIQAYLQTMAVWHEKAREIVRHITTRDPTSVPSSPVHEDTDDMSLSRRGSAEDMDMSSPGFHAKRRATRTPVALLKDGYSLTISDKFSCTIPISDVYAPVDHWQWMATLWRGVVGPDLVVYVKPSVEEEIAKCGTVEFQKRPSLIVVRIPVGRDLDEATERRVAFEVIEWTRGGSFREGFGRA